jgi:hypothetical protein
MVCSGLGSLYFLDLAANGQRFVDKHSDQPAGKSAVTLEPRWITRRRPPTVLDGSICKLGIA